jgi:hypothetical protein
MGRFTSPDPKGFNVGTISKPQKWNKFAYVLNNPLAHVDPDGQEEIQITVRTFIPFQTATLAGQTFSGDNRGFSTSSSASFRTSTTVTLETDPRIRSNPLVRVTAETGLTRRLDDNGKVVQTAKAPPTAQVEASRDLNGNPVVSISDNSKNPLSPGPQALTPGIRSDLAIGIIQNAAGQATAVSVVGSVSGYPATEINVTPPGGSTTQVFGYMPPQNLFFLFTNTPVPPTVTPLPPRRPACPNGGEPLCQ